MRFRNIILVYIYNKLHYVICNKLLSNIKLKYIVLQHTYIQVEQLWKCFEIILRQIGNLE